MTKIMDLVNLLKNNRILIKSDNVFDKIRCFTKIEWNVKGVGNNVVIGKIDSQSKFTIRMIGDNNTIIIGNNCLLRGGELRTDLGSNIEIGSGTRIGGATIHAGTGTSIVIGKECLLSHDIDMRSSDGHYIYKKDNKRETINKPSDIHIGNKVWIGARVQCLKGTYISDNSVVGASSLVTKKFDEPNVVIAGHPAKIINREIFWKR